MSDFLQAIKTVSLDRNEQQPALTEATVRATTSIRSNGSATTTSIKNIEDVVSNLREQPTELDARRQLEWLLKNRSDHSDVLIPSPRSATVLRVIIDVTVPDLWSASRPMQDLLCRCLSSVPGINGLVTTLATSAVATRNATVTTSTNGSTQNAPYMDVLQRILDQEDLFSMIYHGLESASTISQRKLLWKDFVSLMTSGKIISTVAKFQDTIGSDRQCWLASGSSYASHLSLWILTFAIEVSRGGDTENEAAASLLSKSLTLGYNDVLMGHLCKESIAMSPRGLDALARLSTHLRALDQRRFLGFLPLAVQQAIDISQETGLCIQQISAVMSRILADHEALRGELVSWLQTPRSTCAVGRVTRRALITVISDHAQELESVLEKSLQVFGEVLFIRHAPAIEQESCAEIILLTAGRLKQAKPSALIALARSSVHTNGISGRLAASSQRSRALGMIVGMGISRLVDKDNRMDFGVEDVQTPFAKGLLELVNVHDKIGTLEDLRKPSNASYLGSNTSMARSVLPAKTKPVKTKIQSIPTSGPRIIEVLSDDDDDDFAPYTKPDSDPEDDDEDPTLVNRNKPKAPVYIRDLMSGLRDEENYDRHKLSLENAASLIRRKAQFGKEVGDHAVELGTILISLQNTFDLEDFIELRLQALIALLLSNPSGLGPWYSRQVFEGDYSLSQRGTILSAIGLAARELAGYKDTGALNPQVTEPNSFPSKRLPDKYHSIYASPSPKSQPSLTTSPLKAISTSLADSIIAPLAAQAADTATGPSALKVRTFSSRLSAPSRTRIIPNALATTVAESFFTPLVGHFYTHTRASTGGRRANTFVSSVFLGTYLTTLAVLLHASGPSTTALAQLTADFWALLLGVRGHARDDIAVLQAWLFGALTLLELHSGDPRNIATNYGRELVETRDWVSDVYGRLAGGEEEADRVRGLAAGVLVKCGEVMEKYERLLVGEMMQY